ncbi:hypothetical protein [Thiorhodococcus fuscus]|uniref:CheW-like domain-containing protein n=1 Tax=Thiorhodococcus fuscus TaxID=527200 RepID=A0ABW4YC22_9GAMM
MSDIATIEVALSARGLLSFAGVRILLDTGDLRMIESASDLVRTDPPPQGVGWIAVSEQWRPVYALSFDLTPQVDAASAARPVCAVIGDGRNFFGLLCDDVLVSRGEPLAFRAPPRSMLGAGSPILGLSSDHGRLVCGTDAASLARCIGTAIGLDRRIGREVAET